MPPRGSSFNSKMGGKRAEKPLKTLVRLFRYFKNCTGILIVSIISILAYSAASNYAVLMTKKLVEVLEAGIGADMAKYAALLIGMAILYVVVIVVRQVMEPRIVGRQVGLPPLVTLACMFVGTSLFGVWGLFGLPICAAILVNLNNDPDVPIHLFTVPEQEETKSGKVVYRFRKRGEKAPKKETKEEKKP